MKVRGAKSPFVRIAAAGGTKWRKASRKMKPGRPQSIRYARSTVPSATIRSR